MNYCFKNLYFIVVISVSAFGSFLVPSSIFAQVQEVTGNVNVTGTVDIEADPDELDATQPLGRSNITVDDTDAQNAEEELLLETLNTPAFSKNSYGLLNGYHQHYFNYPTFGQPNTTKSNTMIVVTESGSSETSYKPEVGNVQTMDNSYNWSFNLGVPEFLWNDFKTDISKAIFGQNNFFTSIQSKFYGARTLDPLAFHYNVDAFNQGSVFSFSGVLLNGTGYSHGFSTVFQFFRYLYSLLVVVYGYFLTFKVITTF